MRRHSYADRIKTCSSLVRDRICLLHNYRDRTRHESIDKCLRQRSDLGNDVFYLLFITDMADERIVSRASLGFENSLYRFAVTCITAKAVNSLSRETYNFTIYRRQIL